MSSKLSLVKHKFLGFFVFSESADVQNVANFYNAIQNPARTIVRQDNPSFNRFWLIHPCDGQTDRRATSDSISF